MILPSSYHYCQLPNGIEIIGYNRPSIRSITCGIQIGAGRVHEPDDKEGLTHLFEYMLFRGTQQNDKRTLQQAFATLGIHKEIRSGLETTQLWTQAVNTRLDNILRLLQEILLMPAFSERELEQVREIIQQEIQRLNDEPVSRVLELVRAKFYRGAPLGHSTLGTSNSVQLLHCSDLRIFWENHYRPDNTLFVVVGKFNWNHVVEQIETLFGNWPKKGTVLPQELSLQPIKDVAWEVQASQQEHICIIFPFPNYPDPDSFAAVVIREILVGGMNSRLYEEIRVKRGLAYNIHGALVDSKQIGAMCLYMSVLPEHTEKALQIVTEELKDLEEGKIPEEELNRVKIQIKSRYIMKCENSISRMDVIMDSWWYERKVYTDQEIREAVDAVTREQIMQVFHRFQPLHSHTVAAIGPVRDISKYI
jgi:predicted Zn-dependent peptidase